MRRFWSIGRLWDGLALLAILFVVWKLFVAPRSLPLAQAYPAPQASFALLKGGEFHVRDARGHPLILDFFASWCTPCKIELPLVERWAAAHPFSRVVPVDLGEPRAVVAAFARAHGLRDVAYDPHAIGQELFSVQGFPTLVVIDPQGRVRAKWQGLNPAIAAALSHAEATLR